VLCSKTKEELVQLHLELPKNSPNPVRESRARREKESRRGSFFYERNRPGFEPPWDRCVQVQRSGLALLRSAATTDWSSEATHGHPGATLFFSMPGRFAEPAFQPRWRILGFSGALGSLLILLEVQIRLASWALTILWPAGTRRPVPGFVPPRHRPDRQPEDPLRLCRFDHLA
jgi:hypothetical protein